MLCTLCDKKFGWDEAVIAHFGSKGHTQKMSWESPACTDLSVISFDSRPYMRVTDENWIECTLCKKRAADARTMEEGHVSSKQHARKLAAI